MFLDLYGSDEVIYFEANEFKFFTTACFEL